MLDETMMARSFERSETSNGLQVPEELDYEISEIECRSVWIMLP